MIETLSDFLHRYLAVFLALVLIPIKIVVIRLCKDEEGEATAILSIPEDLCYVALGLIISDFVTSSGALRRHFSGSKHVITDIAIVMIFNMAVALAVHLLSQPALRAYKRWRGTEAVREQGSPKQGELAFAASAEDHTLHLIVHHFSTLAMLYGTQLVVVVCWLHWLAKLIANSAN